MSYLSYDILRVEAITRDNHIDYVIQPAQAPAAAAAARFFPDHASNWVAIHDLIAP